MLPQDDPLVTHDDPREGDPERSQHDPGWDDPRVTKDDFRVTRMILR